MPFFSIIVPTYNRVTLLKETLTTVTQQLFRDFEVIVVDNGSSDSTEDYANIFTRDKRFKYIRSKINNERSWSRNKGLGVANGKFVTFLDSDDFMYPNCLEAARDFVIQNPGCVAFHNLYELVSSERSVVHRFHFPSLDNQYKALASSNFVSCIGGFLGESVYPSIRFNEDPRMIGAEDYEVWFDVLARFRLGRINQVNSGIREHPARSVHHGVYDNLSYQEEQLVAKIINSPLLYEKFGRWIPRLKANFCFQRAMLSKDQGNRSLAAHLVAMGFYEDPSIIFNRRSWSVTYNLFKSFRIFRR